MLPTGLLAIFAPGEVVLFSEAETGVYQRESRKKKKRREGETIKTLRKGHTNIVQ